MHEIRGILKLNYKAKHTVYYFKKPKQSDTNKQIQGQLKMQMHSKIKHVINLICDTLNYRAKASNEITATTTTTKDSVIMIKVEPTLEMQQS